VSPGARDAIDLVLLFAGGAFYYYVAGVHFGDRAMSREALPSHKDGVPARRTSEAYSPAYAFWVVLEDGAWGSPLTVFSPDGKEAIALFSDQEEAQLFCHFRADEGANAIIRRTTAGGVLSLMYCPWSPKRVVLDPFPGSLGTRLLGLLTIERARFARRFAGLGSEP
jgi:hypothetical protein